MKAAACSCRVMTSWIDDLRMDSTTSRFSSPGMPKIRSTPSFSSAATKRSEALTVCGWCVAIRNAPTEVAGSRGQQDCERHADGGEQITIEQDRGAFLFRDPVSDGQDDQHHGARHGECYDRITHG